MQSQSSNKRDIQYFHFFLRQQRTASGLGGDEAGTDNSDDKDCAVGKPDSIMCDDGCVRRDSVDG